MDENKPNSQNETPVNPGVVEQLEQIKKAVPDTSQRLFDFLASNLKPIAVGCGIIILAVAAYSGVNHWRKGQAAKAADSLGVILIEKTEPEARIQALEAFLKDSPSSLKPTVLLELAAAAMIGKQYDKAVSAWTELEGSSSPDLKAMAAIGHAKSLIMAEKPKEALTLLENAKAKAPEAYANAITRQMAVAAEAAGDTQAASAAYAELANKAEGSGKPYFEFKANQLKPKS
ncbi:MAG TPA: tetratricopeptide repeat protein [Humidesulfovibrio sp.]|uniref:tetratricopeptide repeat protein n=1 Tax=Humidesulfovibrio sp. TaxID=2910988 RepID=UPI002CD5A380|nr:tetratricopeptide repeat protein [Humidesulfovibrio sp.]HWR05046.1 tetratricopeptide repeat protein [Humidesulfovibrio sp.]